MYSASIEQGLEKILKKLYKKDRKTYESVMKKIAEILQEPHVYKPLSNEMKGRRRVHISSFVLVFSIDEEEKRVLFLDFDHHDKIYVKRF